jgi:hypothetical protein
MNLKAWPRAGSPKMYFLANSASAGYEGRFTELEHEVFRDEWMAGRQVVFVSGSDGARRLAVGELVERASLMSEELFQVLAFEAEKMWMDGQCAFGQALDANFHQRMKEIETVLHAAPWTLQSSEGEVIPKPVMSPFAWPPELVSLRGG